MTPVASIPAARTAIPLAEAERARIAAWREACAHGRCRYPAPGQPERADMVAQHGWCPGYRGTVQPDGTTRYALCPRHVAWWRVERQRRTQQRASEAGRMKRRPTWQEEA